MTTLREAAQQALEAIDWLRLHLRRDHQCLHMDPAQSGIPAWIDRSETNLRAALAEPVQEPDPGEYHGWVLREVLFEKGEPVGHREPPDWDQVEALQEALREHMAEIHRLRAALAEPVQEEVYWYVGTDGKYYSSNEVKLFMDEKTKGLHLDPPQWRKDKGDLIPLYTAPPRCKPLTEEEIETLDCIPNVPGIGFGDVVKFARAIERAVLEKNNG